MKICADYKEGVLYIRLCGEVDEHNAVAVLEMVNAWYEAKLADNPNSDYHMEKAAIYKALDNREKLLLEGFCLFV